jgi:allophanate hydrolase
MPLSLDLHSLATAYKNGLRPSALVDEVDARIMARGEDGVWISRLQKDALLARAAELERTGPSADQPLWGIPFAVKDNIDTAGLPTTAGCPGFRYQPEHSARVVDKLLAAGAILIGKTNLDQFATGLVGVRSPYGIARNPFNPAYIPGGSSSGSAVAVSAGLVSFALGTDTAGSGRVPAGFNNIVGLKPSIGLLSATGMVPACRALDCISIFALTVADAGRGMIRTMRIAGMRRRAGRPPQRRYTRAFASVFRSPPNSDFTATTTPRHCSKPQLSG